MHQVLILSSSPTHHLALHPHNQSPDPCCAICSRPSPSCPSPAPRCCCRRLPPQLMREGCCYINVDAQEVAAMDPLLYRWGEGRRVCEGFCTVVLWGGGARGRRGGGEEGVMEVVVPLGWGVVGRGGRWWPWTPCCTSELGAQCEASATGPCVDLCCTRVVMQQRVPLSTACLPQPPIPQVWQLPLPADTSGLLTRHPPGHPHTAHTPAG